MRTLIISVLIFLTALFSLIPASAQPAEETMSKEQQKEEPAQTETIEMSAVAEPNAEETVDVNSSNDPNVIRARAESYEGLEKALRQLDSESREEVRGWTRRSNDKLDLLLAVQQQTTEELNFLRGLAVEEGAEKTVAAIDVILLDRQERYKSVVERFEREMERLRRAEEREARSRSGRDRTRERTTRGR